MFQFGIICVAIGGEKVAVVLLSLGDYVTAVLEFGSFNLYSLSTDLFFCGSICNQLPSIILYVLYYILLDLYFLYLMRRPESIYLVIGLINIQFPLKMCNEITSMFYYTTKSGLVLLQYS